MLDEKHFPNFFAQTGSKADLPYYELRNRKLYSAPVVNNTNTWKKKSRKKIFLLDLIKNKGMRFSRNISVEDKNGWNLDFLNSTLITHSYQNSYTRNCWISIFFF